jgi:hypothetical protein
MSVLNTLPEISEFDDVENELTSLGLSRDVFANAVKAGLFYVKRTTPFHPVTTSGSRFWEEVTAVIRRELVTADNSKWTFEHFNGLSITKNSAEALSIVATSGNKYTGQIDPERKVKTKNSKGPSTLEYVGRNGDLFEADPFSPKPHTNRKDINETWVFLYHIDRINKEVRSELSLPLAIHQSEGRLAIDEWEKRIVLPKISYSDTIKEQDFLANNPEFNSDIDFNDIIHNE